MKLLPQKNGREGTVSTKRRGPGKGCCKAPVVVHHCRGITPSEGQPVSGRVPTSGFSHIERPSLTHRAGRKHSAVKEGGELDL